MRLFVMLQISLVNLRWPDSISTGSLGARTMLLWPGLLIQFSQRIMDLYRDNSQPQVEIP